MKQRSQHDVYQRTRQRGAYSSDINRRLSQKRKIVLSENARLLMWVLLVPPYGIYKLWTRESNNAALRIAATFLAALIVYLWCLALIPERTPQTYEIVASVPQPITEYNSTVDPGSMG